MAEITKTQLKESVAISSTTASSNPMFVNPANTKTLVQLITVHNRDGLSSETLYIFRVPNASGAVGTTSSTRRLFKIDVDIDETILLELPGGGWVLEEENDSIQFAIGGTNVVNISMDGAQIT